MIKRGLYLVLFILLIQLSLADDFSGYKYPGDKFSLNGDNFSLQISKDWDTLYVKYNDKSLILAKQSCEFTDLKYYLICYDASYVDYSAEPELGKLDERTGKDIPSINLSIRYRKPDIRLTKSFSTVKPLLNEIITIDVSIENNGKNPASINYYDLIPKGFDVTPGSNVAYDGTKIFYVTTAAMGSRKVFSYQLKPTLFLKENIAGNLSYVYEEMSGLVTNPTQLIDVQDNVKYEISFPQSLGILDSGEIIFKFNNADQATGSDVTLWYALPDDFTNIRASPEPLKKGIYNYSFFIPKLGTNTLKVDFKTTLTGNYTIPIVYSFEMYGVKKTINTNVTIKVISDKVEPNLILPTDKIGSNQKFTLKGTIINKDTDTIYYDIFSTINSQFLKESYPITKIVQNQDLVVFNKEVIAPTLEEKTDLDIIFSGKYRTENNEYFEYELKKTITIYPPKETIIVHHEFDKFYNETDKAHVIVFVENIRDKRIRDAVIIETIPNDYQLIAGEITRITALEPKRKMRVYDYTVQSLIGNVSADDIITLVRFNETDKEFTVKQALSLDIYSKSAEKKEITVELDNASFDVKQELVIEQDAPSDQTNAAQNTNSDAQTVKIKSENKSIFVKIKDFILSFFIL